MKLIVEVSDNTVKAIQNNTYCGMLDTTLYHNILYAKPLDSLRDEIEQCLKYAEHNKKVLSDELNKERCIGSAIAFKNVLHIIDGYR